MRKEDMTRKLIIVILIVSILFSVVSMVFSYSITHPSFLKSYGSYRDGKGSIGLYVEPQNTGDEGK